MQMSISEDQKGDVVIVHLEGRFDAGTSGKIEQYLRDKLDKGHTKLVLDMEKTPFIASAGLRVVLVIVKSLRQEKTGDMYIAGMQDSVRRVFEISGMDRVLKLFDSVDEAVEAFQAT